jgi:hypothetical protein
VACSPSLFKVRDSTFDVRRSASGRNLKHRKAVFCPSAVSLAYITRPGRGWSGPKLSPESLPCMPGDSPMTLPCDSPAPIIGLAYATGTPQGHLSPGPRDGLVQGSEEPGARGSTVWGAKLGSDGPPRRGRRGYPPVPDMPGIQTFRLTQFPFSLLYINRAD